MRNKFSPEFWVLFAGLILTGLSMLGANAAWNVEHFASKDELSVERDERREMKAEVDELYNLQVPESQRKPLEHHHYIGEKE